MNGWTNRETWIINLWFEYNTVEELNEIRNMLDEDLDELRNNLPDYLVDLLCVNFVDKEINWNELEGHCEALEGLENE